MEPRRWQKEALDAWCAASHRGVAAVVTGGGKTIFAGLCMDALRAEIPDLRTLVLVPTQALLDQWYVSLREDMAYDESDIALWSGRTKPDEPRRVNVMVLNTGRTAASGVVAGAEVLLVVDECHRAGSPANAKAMAGDHAGALGLSATPERDYDDGFGEKIAPALGDIIYRYGVNDALEDGVLAPFDLVNVAVDLLPDEQLEYDRLTKRIARLSHGRVDNDKPDEHLTRLLRRRARVAALASMRVPVTVRLVEQHRGARALVFHEEIAQAERVLEQLRARNHSATIYHSRISPAVRRDNLRLFRRGVFDVLVSCRALDEGINIPETQVAVIASATASSRQRIQRLGRVLRPAPGKKSATVYTVYATPAEERRLSTEAQALTSARSVSWKRTGVQRA